MSNQRYRSDRAARRAVSTGTREERISRPPGLLPPPRPLPTGDDGPVGPGTTGPRRIDWPSPRLLLIAALLALLTVVVFANSAGSFATDAKPELYFAPWRSAAAYLSSWQEDPQLGVPSFNVGLVPVAVVVGLIQAAGFSAAASVRVLRLLLLVIGALGAARLYRALRPAGERDGAGPLVAAVVFTANPYLVVAGATQAILLPWAFFPWQLLFLVYALREPAGMPWWRRWRWPAAFALTFFAMTGMNAGVVPVLQLLAVPVVVLVLRRWEGVRWRQVAGVLWRSAALVVLLSVYWLVPSVYALRAGTIVTDNSETLAGIFGPTTFAEVLRGLGLWPLYGSGPTGPWLPEYAAYLRNPVVVLASFGLPVLAGLGALLVRGPVRRIGLALVAVAVPIMVGVFPPGDPTPFGRALRAGFDRVPGAAAFRTTNKIGALLVLGVALLVAALAADLLRRRPRATPWLAVGLAALLGAGTLPAWTGQLYSSTVDLPGYWKAAAADLDRGPHDQRVWFVPGEVLSSYRWSQDRPDDLSTSVLTRPSLIRTVIPVTAPAAANLLAATDVGLNEGNLSPGTLSTTARYLGAGDLLLRNDVVWEDSGGGRPQVMQDVVNADPDLRPLGNYGAAGQNTLSSRYPPTSPFEAALPPLQHYGVADPRSIVRTETADGTVLVDGDGWAVSPLVAAGLLGTNPPFRYLYDLTPAEFGRLLSGLVSGTGRIVVTDTNRRRSAVTGRLGNSQGPLLPAGVDPGPTRALGDASDQTVLQVVGGGSAAATEVGSAFGPIASAAPENAVDGNPRTAWKFGDFGQAVGKSIAIRTGGRQPVGSVVVRATDTAGVKVSRVRVDAGGQSREVTLDPSGAGRVSFDPPVDTDLVTVTVTGTEGRGFNLVGIDDIDIPGVRLTRVARLPETLETLATGLDAAGWDALSRTAIDVVLSRVRGTGLPDDDEEAVLARDFTLPIARQYRGYGLIGTGRLDERQLDTLAGAPTRGVRATSTSRAFNLPTVRASQALDGNLSTAWVPGGPVVGQSMTIDAGGPRPVDHVDISQVNADGTAPADWVTRMRVSFDGQPGEVVDLRPGRTRVPVPPRTARTLRLTIEATRTGSAAAPLRLSEVDFAGARIVDSKARAATACVPVSTVDGKPVMMRPVAPITSNFAGIWAGCGRVTLDAGPHSLRPVGAWTPDELVFRDLRGDQPPAGQEPPDTSVRQDRGPGMTINVADAQSPYYLVTGQAYDPRWHATMDGRDLGPPITVDGYSTGWLIDTPGSHTITVRFGPQRVGDAAAVVSVAGIFACLSLLVVRAPVPAPAGQHRPGFAFLAARGGRRRWRTAGTAGLGWGAVILAGWLFGGLVLAAVAAAVAVAHLARPAPKWVIAAAVAAFAAVPVAWLAFRPPLGNNLTAHVVQDNLWPHRLAAAGLLLLVVGVVRAERSADD
jgi:arabinofuranan 3-O-arabinosyltransferase